MPLALLLASACSSNSGDAPGAISADEDRQLNEAAAMLDANSIDIDAVSNTSESPAP